MDNMTLLIDPDTRDLVFDEHGNFKKIYDEDTVVQNVRHALITWKAEFFADQTHGTNYERIMGKNVNEADISVIKEVVREGIFQEPKVSWIDSLDITFNGRSVTATFVATLESGEIINMEVIA
ncbi:MAG: DUF2634 domain-containing protein [Synergistaceae bacterium]|nr:DUF2634 domain-containing protein [Synergistaceae bacterium]